MACESPCSNNIVPVSQLVLRLTSAIISESDNRLIINPATIFFISVLSVVLNLGTLVFCHFVKINILMLVYL